ncbi:MAG: hypothetical protein RJB31_1836, partial [Bacteroidota bacterium]
QAYCETCASVGMVFWNQRMNSLTGNAEYIDVLERSLYNGALDGLSLSGDRFFYGNPLASTGKHSRKEWFGTACCPSNIARLIASLGSYVYGQEGNKIYVNLFVGSETVFPLQKGSMGFSMKTNYPWNGDVQCKISLQKKEKSMIAFRIPGWAKDIPSPGSLYAFSEKQVSMPILTVNGVQQDYVEQNGYATIDREWEDGDLIEFKLSMPIRKILSRDELRQNKGRMALQRGPLVYCVEGADNEGKAWNITAPLQSTYTTEDFSVLDEKVVSIVSNLPVVKISADSSAVQTVFQKVRAIPYYTWCNRGSNPMQVWLPTAVKDIKINY